MKFFQSCCVATSEYLKNARDYDFSVLFPQIEYKFMQKTVENFTVIFKKKSIKFETSKPKFYRFLKFVFSSVYNFL